MWDGIGDGESSAWSVATYYSYNQLKRLPICSQIGLAPANAEVFNN